MLDRVIQRIKGAIVAVTKAESDLQKDLLTTEGWKTLLAFTISRRISMTLSRQQKAIKSSWRKVIPTMDFLAATFEAAVDELTDQDFMRESLHTGFTKLLKYWNRTQRSRAYIAAVLDSKPNGSILTAGILIGDQI